MNTRPLEYISGILAQRCSYCHTLKLFGEFHNDSSKKFKRASRCKQCAYEGNIVWRRNNPERLRQARQKWNRKHLDDHKLRGWRRYGITLTLEGYDKLLTNQDSKCKICGIQAQDLKRKLSPDHDHLTGKIRGLLCGRCNTGLGQFKDNPTYLQSAIQYLEGAVCQGK